MKNLFIPENSGYGRFVTVTVNGKPYTVPVGVNVSVPDEVYTVVMESLKGPETDMGEKGLYLVPTDITLTGNLLQLTANGEAVGNGVTLPRGLRLINSITVADGETATMLKISKDIDGASFSLHNIMFAARLNLPSAQTVTIRLRTNNGSRYLVYKTGVAADKILFVSGESKVFSTGTNTTAEYLAATAEGSGTISGTAYQTFSSNAICKKNISDVEIFLYDASNNFVELQTGTTLEVWGC